MVLASAWEFLRWSCGGGDVRSITDTYAGHLPAIVKTADTTFLNCTQHQRMNRTMLQRPLPVCKPVPPRTCLSWPLRYSPKLASTVPAVGLTKTSPRCREGWVRLRWSWNGEGQDAEKTRSRLETETEQVVRTQSGLEDLRGVGRKGRVFFPSLWIGYYVVSRVVQ